MAVFYILIGISIIIASGFLASYIWSVKSGQFDDAYTPPVRILFEETSEDNHQQDNISK